jgi:ubiquinone/menaquinone biosynthesis C-methylase UbiE
VVGVDVSAEMLEVARRRGGHAIEIGTPMRVKIVG